ncbi:hypothetical protein QBC35DRAFT_72559 [Podospora australis]|uniref:Pre-mRNA splicing factor CLF1 n=1 Tax=Podospora australis TaxID=1536484 RepID=A0AAN7ALK5_9PEZI|nr:hypothetical protein QBC35DRAFT_72559 [Podospora australis]
MALPQPEKALNNVCSVIFENTLYTYSADAFQSLNLEPGSEWEVLPQGEKVTGGVCVGAATGAFFVVGGKGQTGGYQGLQKYTYATKKWETVQLTTPDLKDRTGHSAAYLPSTDSIVVYGGGQGDSSGPSSQTFTVDAAPPNAIFSFQSWAPPAVKPILLPWSTSEAVMVGGSADNTQVFLFSRERGWENSGATLAAPIPKDTSAIQAVLMTGDDGSKSLVSFDMSVSPNLVSRTVLFSAPGIPAVASTPVRKRTTRRGERKRAEALTLSNWPAYNSTLAPKATRSNFGLAQNPDGMVVIAGGNDDDVLCMFDARANSWQNATAMLGQIRLLSVESSTSLSSSSTTSTSTTLSSITTSTTSPSITSDGVAAATATETPTETAAPVAATGGSGPGLNTILGAVLGSVFGLALILGLLYFCLKRRQRQQAHAEAGHLRRASGASSTEKEMGFAKDSMTRGQPHPGVYRGHQSSDSKSSFSSLAILMGRNDNKPKLPGLGRGPSNGSKRDSGDSVFRAFKSTISKPILPEVTQPTRQQSIRVPTRDEKGVSFATDTAEPRPRNLTTTADQQGRRSSGWNRYWSGGSALNLLGFGNGNTNANATNANNTNNNSKRTTLSSERSSNYSQQGHRITQDSVTVPRLQIYEPRLSFSRVTSHSPTIASHGNSNLKLNEGMSAQIETQRPVSALSEGSMSAYSSGIPESVHEAWDPTAANRPWGLERQGSSYTGVYVTPLAPASQGTKPAVAEPSRKQPSPVRDDMSWLNLG